MTEQVEQQICIKFCVKLEHSSMEAIPMIRRPQLWAAGDWQLITTTCLLRHHISCRGFWGNIKSPRWLSPPTAQIWCLQLTAFPETFEREMLSDCWWDSGKYDGAAHGYWENCVRSQGAYFEGDWGFIVLCTVFLVSSSVDVSIFHVTQWILSGQTSYINSAIQISEVLFNYHFQYYHSI